MSEGFRAAFWASTGADLKEMGSPHSAQCIGHWECPYRPKFVVHWTENLSGLPGLGEETVYAVCFNHINRVLSAATGSKGYATVTQFKELVDD
ncbi:MULTISPECIES: hypothetical protein [Streptomyces]|uniref:hypothetical protein n=1 Tax=Streptomyces TaxID=1883 RepID=UPI0033C8E67B